MEHVAEDTNYKARAGSIAAPVSTSRWRSEALSQSCPWTEMLSIAWAASRLTSLAEPMASPLLTFCKITFVGMTLLMNLWVSTCTLALVPYFT